MPNCFSKVFYIPTSRKFQLLHILALAISFFKKTFQKACSGFDLHFPGDYWFLASSHFLFVVCKSSLGRCLFKCFGYTLVHRTWKQYWYPLSLFLFSKVVLAVKDLLHFHVNLEANISISTIKFPGILIGLHWICRSIQKELPY